MKRGSMKMATDSNLPPLSFINQQNQLDGFDVDVGKEVARRLGVKLDIITPEWTVITAGHWNGRWDISIGSMTPTADRAKVFDFPAIYYYTPASFVVHKNSTIQKRDELNGKVVGAPSGTTYEKYLRHDLTIDATGAPSFTYDVKPGTIKTLSASTALMDDLRLGAGVRLDSILYALPSLNEAIKKGYPFRIVGEPVFYEPLAIAIEKGDKEFADKLRATVTAMQADGTLRKLSEQWFGTDYSKPSM
jgi:polar amino acid transport system substrate-binding protein